MEIIRDGDGEKGLQKLNLQRRMDVLSRFNLDKKWNTAKNTNLSSFLSAQD